MNKDTRFFKPLGLIGLIISSGLTVIFALIAFIITAVDSTYDDGYGVSYSYGRKDLLFIILSSIVILLLGVILLSNSLKKKKTEDWILPAFILASSTISSFFMLGSIINPIFNNEPDYFTINYVMNLITTIIGIAALVIGIIVLVFTLSKKNAYQSYILSYVMVVCLFASLVVYCLNQGVGIIKDTIGVGIILNDLIVGICFILVDVSLLLENSMLSMQIKDSRLR